jgi:hypothetical protein
MQQFGFKHLFVNNVTVPAPARPHSQCWSHVHSLCLDTSLHCRFPPRLWAGCRAWSARADPPLAPSKALQSVERRADPRWRPPRLCRAWSAGRTPTGALQGYAEHGAQGGPPAGTLPRLCRAWSARADPPLAPSNAMQSMERRADPPLAPSQGSAERGAQGGPPAGGLQGHEGSAAWRRWPC